MTWHGAVRELREGSRRDGRVVKCSARRGGWRSYKVVREVEELRIHVRLHPHIAGIFSRSRSKWTHFPPPCIPFLLTRLHSNHALLQYLRGVKPRLRAPAREVGKRPLQLLEGVACEAGHGDESSLGSASRLVFSGIAGSSMFCGVLTASVWNEFLSENVVGSGNSVTFFAHPHRRPARAPTFRMGCRSTAPPT